MPCKPAIDNAIVIRTTDRYGNSMKTVTISPKFQVVIPEVIREAMKLKAGEKVVVFQYENRIEYVPQRKLSEMRGFLRGLDTNIDRELDRV